MVAPGGHAWLLSEGGMHGCSGGACMVAPGGACVVAQGGMHGCSGGACMVAPGGHAWLLWGGHVWLLWEWGHAWLLRGGMLDNKKTSKLERPL